MESLSAFKLYHGDSAVGMYLEVPAASTRHRIRPIRSPPISHALQMICFCIAGDVKHVMGNRRNHIHL